MMHGIGTNMLFDKRRVAYVFIDYYNQTLLILQNLLDLSAKIMYNKA